MDVRLNWIDCDETGDYVVPNVFSLWDLVSRPDNMDELYYTYTYMGRMKLQFMVYQYVQKEAGHLLAHLRNSILLLHFLLILHKPHDSAIIACR